MPKPKAKAKPPGSKSAKATKGRKGRSSTTAPAPAEPVLSKKEQSIIKRRAALERKKLINFTIFAALGSCTVGIGLGALQGDPKIGIGAALALLVLSLSFKYPRQALWAFLIYMPFSGTVVYALGGNALLQLAKDAFYIPALLSIVQTCQRDRLPILIPKQIIAPLSILLALSLMTLMFVNGSQAMEAASGAVFTDEGKPEKPILLGILGLKVLMGYVPLITCTFYLLRTKKEFLFLMRSIAILVIICCALCLMQYIFLKTGRCQGTVGTGSELFKASLEARCLVGGSLLYTPEQNQIRLPGTFVAPWQWGWFLISSAFFTFGTAFSDPKFGWRTVGLVSMAAVSVAAVISGQRIALVLVPIIFGLLAVLTGQVTNLKRFIPIGVGLGGILGVAAAQNPAIVQERIDSFVSRWNASPPYNFIYWQFIDVYRMQEGILGNGLGRATNSARTFGKTILLETYYPKMLHEIGPLGVFAFLALVTTLLVVTFKAYRSVKDKNFRSYGGCLWVFLLFISYNTYYYPLDVDPVAVYYWLMAGAILKLPELDRQEALNAIAPETDLPPPKRRSRRVKAA